VSEETYPIKISAIGGMALKGTTVHIGDFMVPHVRTVTFTHTAGELPMVEIHLWARDGLEIESDATVNPIVCCPNCMKEFDEKKQLVMEAIKLRVAAVEAGAEVKP
jgi:hypothetical protein